MEHDADAIEARTLESACFRQPGKDIGVDPSAGPPPHAARAIALIADEHRAIAGMLSAMQALLASCRGAGHQPDFTSFEAMLAYVENVPDHVHHPKEDAVLFSALMCRARIRRERGGLQRRSRG